LRIVPANSFCAACHNCGFTGEPRHDCYSTQSVMPALVAGIHVLQDRHHKDVDGTRNCGLPELRRFL
jgi:hypothetical protein